MQCKVKIGSAYEPRWFERRYTSGTYSAKNPPLDADEMWLQNALIAPNRPRLWKKIIWVSVAWLTGLAAYASFFI